MRWDIGFTWYLLKSFRFPVAIFVWSYCVTYGYYSDSPDSFERSLARTLAFSGLIYALVTLGTIIVKDKYKEYREQQEKAWNIIKDSK